VHAINRALFGSMARWLNEGLAQVLTANTSNTESKVPRTKYSMSKGKLFRTTDEDWAGPLRNQLYLSKAFIHQLMATERGRNSIARLLLAEQVNGCNDLTSGDVSKILGWSYDNSLISISGGFATAFSHDLVLNFLQNTRPDSEVHAEVNGLNLTPQVGRFFAKTNSAK
jgi:hypothetical protein